MRNLTLLVAIGASLVGCDSVDDPYLATAAGSASPDRLEAGEVLYPGESISSGSTALVYQDDDNLVLYQGGGAIWASMTGLGAAPDHFAMQSDCNAVVYAADGYVWASGTDGRGSSCTLHVVEGDWFICSGGARVFSALGGGDCGGGEAEPLPAPMDLSQMARIGADGEAVSAYLIHMLQNTEISVFGTTRTYWDMIDQTKFMVSLGFNGGGTDSYRVFFHYSAEGHSMIANAQFNGAIRYRNTNDGSFSPWIGFTQGGIFDPTLAHPNMDHAFKSLFEESDRDLCLQPQWNEGSTVGEVDIDFHRQAEVIDHGRPDNSDPLTTCSGGCKNNNAAFLGAWGSPGGLPGYAGPMTVSQSNRGPVHDFHQQRQLPGYDEVATVLVGRGIAVATGDVAVPR